MKGKKLKYYKNGENYISYGFWSSGIWVPYNFVSNGVTFPIGYIKNLLEFKWGVLESSILHDYLYSCKMYDRKKCDKIFDESMKEKKVNIIIRSIVYLTVRIFGSSYYVLKKMRWFKSEN